MKKQGQLWKKGNILNLCWKNKDNPISLDNFNLVQKINGQLFLWIRKAANSLKKLNFFRQPQPQKLKTLKYLQFSEEVIIKTSEAVVGQIQRDEAAQIRKYVLLKKQTLI